MKIIKAFTWGYKGWGNASGHFVRAVDSLEGRRGFKPPVFIDLRISRQVRARDFRDDEFASIVGEKRYVWMRKLGNKRILSKRGKRIQIADPNAVSELLELIVKLAPLKRRVVMFCSCLTAELRGDDGEPSCHRVAVASLLLKAARKAGIRLEMAEWPGESPSRLRRSASRDQDAALGKGARYVPLNPVGGRAPPEAGIGWGSVATFATAEQEWTIVTGPAYVKAGVWKLEVLYDVLTGAQASQKAEVLGRRFRKSGYGPRTK